MSWFVAVLGGCDEAAEVKGGERQLADYVGIAGTRIELAPAAAPDEVPLQLLIGEDSWTLRMGERWDDAEPVAGWKVTTKPALVVEGEELLSMPLPDAVTFTTWYGEFAESVHAAPNAGELAGEWVFARGIGPVVATVDSVRRECVFYEYGADALADTGDD